MVSKICSSCKLDLDISNFYIHNKKLKNGTIYQSYQSLCKQCASFRRNKYYLDNLEQEKLKRKSREVEIKEWFLDLKKTYSCSKCNEDRWYLIDFHHTDSNKEHNIADICNRYGKATILKEINKCIPLCANCHRELHYLEKLQL